MSRMEAGLSETDEEDGLVLSVAMTVFRQKGE